MGETGEESEEMVYGRAREGIESSREEEEVMVREGEEGVTSLCRREERTLYLVVRKGESWEFRMLFFFCSLFVSFSLPM